MEPQGISYEPIIERIEELRKGLSLSKTKFAEGAGLCVQTYNNFTGKQGSKPSLALVMGVVAAYIRPEGQAATLYWITFGGGDSAPSAFTQADRIGKLEEDVAKLMGHTHHKAGWMIYPKSEPPQIFGSNMAAAPHAEEPPGKPVFAGEDCPFAATDMTPCYQKDGEMALDVRRVCVGCGREEDGLVKMTGPNA